MSVQTSSHMQAWDSVLFFFYFANDDNKVWVLLKCFRQEDGDIINRWKCCWLRNSSSSLPGTFFGSFRHLLVIHATKGAHKVDGTNNFILDSIYSLHDSNLFNRKIVLFSCFIFCQQKKYSWNCTTISNKVRQQKYGAFEKNLLKICAFLEKGFEKIWSTKICIIFVLVGWTYRFSENI